MYRPRDPGWDYCSLISNRSYEEQAFELARLQRERTNSLPANIVDSAYHFSRAHLTEDVLPDELADAQVLLYIENGIKGIKGGGLQFNHGDVGVRTRVYHVEGDISEPDIPFSLEEADTVLKAAQVLCRRAWEFGRISLSPDMTTIHGHHTPYRIIQVLSDIE